MEDDVAIGAGDTQAVDQNDGADPGVETDDQPTVGEVLGLENETWEEDGEDGDEGEGEEIEEGEGDEFEDSEGEEVAEEPAPTDLSDSLEAKSYALDLREKRQQRNDTGDPFYGVDAALLAEVDREIFPILDGQWKKILNSYSEFTEKNLLGALEQAINGGNPKDENGTWDARQVVNMVRFMLFGNGQDDQHLPPAHRSLFSNLSADLFRSMSRVAIESAEHFHRKGSTQGQAERSAKAQEDAFMRDFTTLCRENLGVKSPKAVTVLAKNFRAKMVEYGVDTQEKLDALTHEFLADQKELREALLTEDKSSASQRRDLQRQSMAGQRGGRLPRQEDSFTERLKKNEVTLGEAMRAH